MNKKVLAIFSVVIVASMLLAACGQSAEGGVKEADCAKEDVLCIGLVTDVGEVDDKSFNQAAWEGTKAAAEKYSGLANYIETKDAKDYAANIQLFVDKAYDIIVTVGFAITDTTIEVAIANPGISFIGVDQGQWSGTTPNVAGLIFDEAKSGFLAGVLAAGLSSSGTVAAVLGTDLVPPVVNFNLGYIAGAKYVNPDINVISTYHPGGMDVAFTDPEWGAATAKQAIEQGADVIFGAGGKTGNGALIETASNPGLFCIGVDSDQWETVPEAHPCLVSSAIKLISPSVIELVDLYQTGAFPAGNFVGGSGLAPFHDLDSAVSQEVKDMLALALTAYENGEITIQ